MFDHITILRQPSVGQLAEMLLFYGKVTLFVNESLLRTLCKQLEPHVLVDFLETHQDSLALRKVTWVIWSSSRPGSSRASFTLGDENTIGMDEPYLDYLRRTSMLDTRQGYVKDTRLTDRLLARIHTDYTESTRFNSIFNDDLVCRTLPAFCQSYVTEFKPANLRELPQGLQFQFEQSGGAFHLSFTASDQLSPPQCECIKDIAATYITTVAEMPIWGTLSSELLVDRERSFVIQDKLNDLVNRVDRSKRELEVFEYAVLEDAKAIAEAVDSGARSFSDFIAVYEKAKKFRRWLNDLPFDANLAAEYIRAVAADNWTAKLPAKSVRWAFFTGLGLGLDALGASGVGTAAGVSLSVLDTFVLDSLIKGWKPSQFVDKELSQFAKGTGAT